MRQTLWIAALLWSLGGAAAPAAAGEIEDVGAVLDRFHGAAAAADEESYFGLLASDAVFLGTDGSERWTKDEFRAYAHPHFSSGRGWTFTPRDRRISLSADGMVAWFDEALDSASYGSCRGSGVLQKGKQGWKIEQYNLSIPIPNELAREVVASIRRSR